jgi:hypothetical protein
MHEHGRKDSINLPSSSVFSRIKSKKNMVFDKDLLVYTKTR